MAFVFDRRGKCADHFRVGDVLFLGDGRHQQMLPDQPDDQARYRRRRCRAGAEWAASTAPSSRVVAPASLGDVVEQGGDVEHPGAGKSLISSLQSGYSWVNSSARKRRRLRRTCRCAGLRCRRGTGRAASGRRSCRNSAGSGPGCRTGSSAGSSCSTPRGCCMISRKRRRLSGSRRKSSSISVRACHSARRVRAVIPCSSGCFCISRKGFENGRRVAVLKTSRRPRRANRGYSEAFIDRL
jgi:hypothetical protein